MADISIVINPAETIAANILPPNSISIGPSTSYPPHAPSHAPGAYDSLSSYYVTTESTGNFVTTAQTGSLASPIIQVRYQEITGHFSGGLSGDFRYASTPVPNASANLFFSLPITPSSSNSLININAFCLFSSTLGTQTTIMVSRSGETFCRYQNTNLPSTVRSDYVTAHVVNWSEIAQTTETINYEIRAVTNSSNIFLNRSAASASYPTNNKSSLLIQEIKI